MTDDSEDTMALGSPVKPGDLLAGKYRIDRVLGAGGMGVVVAATHLELNDRVAVKFLLPHALMNEEAIARFVREARAAVRIKGEHVARVIDVGRLENSAPYMVMEYLEGHDLGRSNSSGPLPVEEAVDYVLQTCDAMAEAHAAGIVHRDLKPANLFRTERADGSAVIKVLDFGISKVADPSISDAGLTRTATAMGSPLYMSPEQLRSAKDVDLRTDIWSLGAILYELLTATTPFTGESYPELCAEILGNPPRPLRQFRPDVPEGLVEIVERCLRKDPGERYASVAELALALVPFAPEHARRHAERARRVLARAGMSSIPDTEERAAQASAPPPPPAPPGVARTAAAWSETGPTEKPRSRALAWIGGLAVIGAVAVGAAMFGRSTVNPGASASAEATETAATAAPSATPTASVAPVVAPEPELGASAAPEAGTTSSTRAAEPPPPRPRDARAEPKKTEPKEAKPEPKETKPEPKETPAPKPTATEKKNPLDIGLK